MKLVSIFVFVTCVGASLPAFAQARKPAGQKETPEHKPGVPRPHEPKPAPIQPKAQPTEVGIGSAKSLFKLTDADANGTLDLKEAASAGLGPRDLAAGDLDANHLLNQDEFLVAYGSNQARLGRPVSKELTHEAARISAARPAGAKAPAASGKAPPAAVPTPKSEIERKIAEALRTAKASSGAEPNAGPRGETKRERRPAAKAEAGEFGAKLQQSLVDLNRRLRNAEVSPEEAAIQREKLEQRIANAQAAKTSGGDAASGEGTSVETAPAAPSNSEAVARAAMEKRLADQGATPEQVAEARAKFEARLQKTARSEARRNHAADREGSDATTPASSSDDSAAPDAKKKSAEEVAGARERFGDRLQKTKRAEALRQHAGSADESTSSGSDASTTPASGEAAPGTPPPRPAPEPDPQPAPPPASRDARAKVVGDNVEKRLSSKGAAPEEIEKARERVQRRAEAARPDAPAPQKRTAPAPGVDARRAPPPDKPAEAAGKEPPKPAKDAPPRADKHSAAYRDPLLERASGDTTKITPRSGLFAGAGRASAPAREPVTRESASTPPRGSSLRALAVPATPKAPTKPPVGPASARDAAAAGKSGAPTAAVPKTARPAPTRPAAAAPKAARAGKGQGKGGKGGKGAKVAKGARGGKGTVARGAAVADKAANQGSRPQKPDPRAVAPTKPASHPDAAPTASRPAAGKQARGKERPVDAPLERGASGAGATVAGKSAERIEGRSTKPVGTPEDP